MISRPRRYRAGASTHMTRVIVAVGAIDGGGQKCKGHREKVNFKEISEVKVTAGLKSDGARRTKGSVSR